MMGMVSMLTSGTASKCSLIPDYFCKLNLNDFLKLLIYVNKIQIIHLCFSSLYLLFLMSPLQISQCQDNAEIQRQSSVRTV